MGDPRGEEASPLSHPLQRLRRWMYAGQRPNGLARVLNRVAAAQYTHSVLVPPHAAVLEVPGRHSGRSISVPLLMTVYHGRWYLVAMLGERSNWVSNVRAAGGHAVLRRGRRQPVRLHEVPVADRAPILRRYLILAPGARAHIPLDPHAPLDDFPAVAARFPVFLVEFTRPAPGASAPPTGAGRVLDGSRQPGQRPAR